VTRVTETLRPRAARIALATATALLLTGCGAADRLSNVGKAPSLSAIEDPTTQPGYKPVSLPMPAPPPAAYAPNSLWKQGARTFFKDQRAQRVGDILTVKVTVADKAEFDNATTRTRAGKDSASVGGLAGLFMTKKVLPKGFDPSDLASDESASSHTGTGKAARSETLETNVAAVVTQILPNGNLVVEGKQEVRVNFEKRELIVAGIIRPEDIAADNTIDSTKIAEARISYGGKGQLTDMQQPRYGQQVLDVLLPF
jgi:flagellar L-ring protein precursor FlgH